MLASSLYAPFKYSPLIFALSIVGIFSPRIFSPLYSHYITAFWNCIEAQRPGTLSTKIRQIPPAAQVLFF